MAAKQQKSQQDDAGRTRAAGRLSRTLDHGDDLTSATANAVDGAGGSSGSLGDARLGG